MIWFSTKRPRRSGSSVREGSEAAFSLTEIAVAIGIVAFVIVSLVGLMSVGLSAQRSAREDTILVSVTKQALSTARSGKYSDLVIGAASSNFYTSEGYPTNAASAFYVCEVSILAPTNNLPGSLRAKEIRFKYNWPYQSRPNYPNEQVFATTIAEYP